MGRSSRQAASDISWDKMAEKAERGLEIKTRRRDRKRKAETIRVPLSLLVDMKVTAIVYNWQADVFLMH